MQKHTHVSHGGHDVWIVNADGTDSHGTTRDGVPGWVMGELRAKRIIEEVRKILRSKSKRSGQPARRVRLLVEGRRPRKRLLTFKEFIARSRR
jgi:hypothetical protein